MNLRQMASLEREESEFDGHEGADVWYAECPAVVDNPDMYPDIFFVLGGTIDPPKKKQRCGYSDPR